MKIWTQNKQSYTLTLTFIFMSKPRKIVWTESKRHIAIARILHYALLPVLLIGSDLLIGFLGHYSGSTDGTFTWDAYITYLQTPGQLQNLVIVFIIAVAVVAIVETIVRQHKK